MFLSVPVIAAVRIVTRRLQAPESARWMARSSKGPVVSLEA